jgi:FkbM family methyltransferase
MNGGLRRLARRALGPADLEEAELARPLVSNRPHVMIDAGANVGGSLSGYARRGWEVHASQPDPAKRAALARSFAVLDTVTIASEAVSAADRNDLPLYASQVSNGISSLTPFHESRWPTSVATCRLDTDRRSRDVGDVGFLAVDAEGHDRSLLQSFPWDTVHPTAVLCKFEEPKAVPLRLTYRDSAEFLVSQGDAALISEWHSILEDSRPHTWRRAVLFPAVLSVGAWGYLLAVSPDSVQCAPRAFRVAAARLKARQLVQRIR